MNTIWLGFGASLLAGMGTAIGALPVLGMKQVSPRWQGLMLGLGGGVRPRRFGLAAHLALHHCDHHS
jgi:zinc transporter ZupT